MDITELLETPDGAVLAAIGGEVALVTMRHETANRVTIECFPMGASTSVDAVLQLLGAHGFASREPAIAVAPVETPALPAPADHPHVCPECDQRFARKDHLNRHLSRVHGRGAAAAPPVPPLSPYPCPECGKGFTTKKGLGHHRSMMHGVAGVAHAAKPGDVACPDCPNMFANTRALGAHRFRTHGVHGKTRREPVTGDHQCATCEARFETPVALRMHEMKVHHVDPTPAIVAAAVESPTAAVSIPAPTPVSLDVAPRSESQDAPASQDRKIRAVLGAGSCPVCHEPLLTHEACDGCGILVGPGHETEHRVFISGADYCRDCARARIVARKAELVAA